MTSKTTIVLAVEHEGRKLSLHACPVFPVEVQLSNGVAHPAHCLLQIVDIPSTPYQSSLLACKGADVHEISVAIVTSSPGDLAVIQPLRSARITMFIILRYLAPSNPKLWAPLCTLEYLAAVSQDAFRCLSARLQPHLWLRINLPASITRLSDTNVSVVKQFDRTCMVPVTCIMYIQHAASQHVSCV